MIVGDAIHNLRASLDILAVALVARNGGNTKGVYFPFADSAENFEEMIRRRHFDRASATDQSILRNLRPYKGGNHLLRSLHDLDIQDKHHSLIPHASLAALPPFRVRTDEAGHPIGFDEGKVQIEVDQSVPPQLQFMFPKGSAFEGEEVVPTLWRLHQHVQDIVEQFAGVADEA